MTKDDNFDTDLEQEVTGEEFESAEGEADTAVPAPKKSGGGFVFKAVLLLAVLGGGGFFLARSGLLPVSIPGVTPEKVQAAQNALPVPVAAKAAETPSAVPATQLSAVQELPPAIGTTAPAMPIVPPVMAQENDPFADMALEQKPDADIPASGNVAAAPTSLAPQADPFADVVATTPAPVAFPTQEPSGETQVMAAEITPVDPVAEVPGIEMKSAPVVPVESASVPSTAVSADVTALQERLDTLEERLDNLESSIATKSDLSALADSIKSLEKGLKASAVRVERKKEDVAPVASSSAKGPSSERRAARPESQEKDVLQWTLRSAKPGMAWVSEKGSSELRTVTVGDELPGIGKITAIFKDSTGRWVVKGPKGSVNQ